MKRVGNIKEKISDFKNVVLAYKKAIKHKRKRKEVMKYTRNLEENLIQLINDIVNDTYEQGEHRVFKVYEPKLRIIKALPFTDRVFQHAVNNILEPIFEATFYEHSYACRKGKGSHKASSVLKSWLYTAHRYGIKLFCLKGDIRKYFDSVRTKILTRLICRKLKCKDMEYLLEAVIQSKSKETGIPIGNLLSQLFANIYLNELDTFVKHELKIKYYIRYMDDFLLLSTSKEELHKCLEQIIEFLDKELKLSLNDKTRIFPVKDGVEFVGYVHYYSHIKMRKSSFKRGKKKIRKAEKGLMSNKITLEQFRSKVYSVIGHIKHTDNYKLVAKYEERYEYIVSKYREIKMIQGGTN